MVLKPHYYFDMTQKAYDYIMASNILKESKKEKTILNLCLDGKSIKEISNEVKMSDRTINRRKKDIYDKINIYF